jgi:hypothetical protein
VTDESFDVPTFSDIIDVHVSGGYPSFELARPSTLPLSELPLDLHLQTRTERPCVVIIPLGAAGDEVTLVSETGSLNLRLEHDGISFVAPNTHERGLIQGQFLEGADLTLRPLMAAPGIPAVCQHGIRPIRFCPFNPP